jgi:hypothetical protein
MRRVTALLCAAALVLWTVGSFAQAKPDLSGKCSREAAAAGAAAAGGGGGGRAGGGGGGRQGGGGGGGGFACGMECTIAVAGGVLKVARVQGENTINWEVKLDGSASTNMQAGRGGGEPTAIVSTAKWDGAKLVISTTRDIQGTSVTSTQTLSIDGGKLTVVSSAGREGMPAQTATYTKG